MSRDVQKPLQVRWMIRRDMPDVLQMEEENFEYSWTEDDFIKSLRQRNTIGMVAERGEFVEGFVIYELHLKKLTIINLAVAKRHQRTGVGRTILHKMKGKLSRDRRHAIFATTRETNLAAQLFFQANDFKAIKTHHNFYENTNEDAYEFQYSSFGAPTNRITEYMEGRSA